MAIDFPSSPTVGRVYTYLNRTFEFDGEKWINTAETETGTGTPFYVTPEDFGAVGDGAADDTVAVQAAFDQIPQKNVYLPRTYVIGAPLIIKPSSYGFTFWAIRGEPRKQTFKKRGTFAFIQLDASLNTIQDFEISDITFFDSTWDPDVGGMGIYITGGAGDEVLRGTFRNLSGWNLAALFWCDRDNGVSTSIFDNITLWNCGRGIYLKGSGTANVFSNILGGTTGGFGIDIGDGVRNCGDLSFSNIQGGGGAGGIRLRGSPTYGDMVSIYGLQWDSSSYAQLQLDRMANVHAYGNWSNTVCAINNTCRDIFIDHSATITPAQLTANTDNYNPTGLSYARYLFLSSNAARNLTGLMGGWDGRRIGIFNSGSYAITLKNNVTSTDQYRFWFNSDVVLQQQDMIELRYSIASGRWIKSG